jgi:hypothetical protein
MELWQAWADNAGSAIAELGAPLGDAEIVGDGEAHSDIVGYSILDALSREAVVGLLEYHPHFHTPNGRIELHEMLPVPGM